jgi:hypothetical protein
MVPNVTSTKSRMRALSAAAAEVLEIASSTALQHRSLGVIPHTMVKDCDETWLIISYHQKGERPGNLAFTRSRAAPLVFQDEFNLLRRDEQR